jgi:hypothetical protein
MTAVRVLKQLRIDASLLRLSVGFVRWTWRDQNKPMRVRLKDMLPCGASHHGCIECSFFSESVRRL